MRFHRVLFAATVVALVPVAGAAGHVSIKPVKAPAESFARFTLIAPTEGESPMASLKIQLPPGVTLVTFPPKPGWKRTITTKRFAKPVTVDGTTVTERIATVEWSGGAIGAGETGQFSFSAHLPRKPGAKLLFPAIQTYANGVISRWIGAPDADEPGPFVTLGAAKHRPAPAPPPPPPPPPPPTTTSAAPKTTGEDDSDRTALILGLAVAGLLVAGLGALTFGVRRRRRA